MTSRARTLTALIGVMLLVGLGAIPAASATSARHWVAVDGQATGGAEGINDAGDVLVIDSEAQILELHRADGVDVDLTEPPHVLAPPDLVGPNDAGQVLASYEDWSGNFVVGIFDRDGHFTALRPPPGTTTGDHVGGSDINNNGVVIGTAEVAGRAELVHWTRQGHPRVLHTDVGDVGLHPVAVNDHGDIAAWVDGHSGPAGRRGVVLNRDGHVLRYLHRLPGEDLDQPVDINDAGVVIGQANIPGSSLGLETYVPLRWGNLGRPHRFAAPKAAWNVSVSAINDHGVMVGGIEVPFGTTGDFMTKPVVWTSTTEYTVLHSLPVPPDPFDGDPLPQAGYIAVLNDRNVLAGCTFERDYGELTVWPPTG